MAAHSSILAWKIPWTEEPGYSPWGHRELETIEWLSIQGLQHVLNTGMMCLIGDCKVLLPCVQNGSEKPRSKAGWPIRHVDDDGLGMPGSSNSGERWVDSRNNWHSLLLGLDVVPVTAMENTGVSEKGTDWLKVSSVLGAPKSCLPVSSIFTLFYVALLWKKYLFCCGEIW